MTSTACSTSTKRLTSAPPRPPKKRPRSPRRKPPASSLRGVFFGTSDFAVPALHAFASAVRCELAITQPDRPGGRGQKLQPTPVKTAARDLGIATLEPERLREALPVLRELDADLFAVASYGKIVPQTILDLPRLGALNVHPSLLPLYRGATPLQAQLRDGVALGGVTIILMDAGMDTGDIVLQRESAIGSRETYGELHDRFAALGAELLGEACARALAGTLVREPQAGRADQRDVARTLTRPLAKDDLALAAPGDDLRAFAIVDKIRSLSPAPGARVDLPRFGRSKVLAGHVLLEGPPVDVASGTCVAIDGWLLLRAADGWVAIDELGVPGRRAMRIADFRSGNKRTEPDNLRPVLERWLGENEQRLTGFARA